MIAERFRCALLAGSVLFLAACATGTHPLGMQIAGSARSLTGALHVGNGAQDVTLTSDDGQLACNGVSLLGDATSDCRASGALRLQCTDGRAVTGNWTMDDCAQGRGEGVDSEGNAVMFRIGAGSTDGDSVAFAAMPASQAMPRRAPVERQADSHLFRFGGSYAAGFGSPQQFAHDAAFTDVESGLVIVRIDTPDNLPMTLGEEPLQARQEAFVVMPPGMARIERVRIEYADSRWEIAGGASLPPGLPVMNFDGQVIALTNGSGVVPAHSLRRYLQLVAPSLAGQRAVRATADQLRERIMMHHID